MPVLERRKVHKTKAGTYRLNAPKDWGDFFNIQDKEALDTIADAPWVVFPQQVKTKKDRIEALRKIITLIEATPERPYPIAHRGPKKGG